MIQLSERLSAIAEYVRRGDRLADIGTDHALLPTCLVQRGTVQHAVAGDLNSGPVQAAARQVTEAGLTEYISVRGGNGLEVLRPSEVDTVVVAGMGGATIENILTAGKPLLQGVNRLILQPNVGERLVREWLWREGWKLSAERLVEEDGIIYEIMVADAVERPVADGWNEQLYRRALPVLGNVSESVRLLMGPLLLTEATDLFLRKWTAYTLKLDKLIAQIERSKQPEARIKRTNLLLERNEVKEVLTCLLT